MRQEVDPEANIIVGATFDESLVDRVRVSIGVGHGAQRAPQRAPGALPSRVGRSRARRARGRRSRFARAVRTVRTKPICSAG